MAYNKILQVLEVPNLTEVGDFFLEDNETLLELYVPKLINVGSYFLDCNKTLQDYEDQLHLVEKFVNIKEKIHRIHGLAKNCERMSKEELVSEVEHISLEILEEL